MANRKFSQFTAGGASQVPTDVLVGLDLSQASALQNTKWTLNNLFAKPTLNITDGAMRFGAPGSAPAVSAAAEGSIYFDGTQFQVSSNAGAYTPLGDVSGSFTSGQVVYANGTKSLTGSSGFTFAANALTLGTAGTPGGLRLVGTSGNYWNLASNAPAGNRTLYFPDSTTPTTGNFLFVGTFGATVVTDWSTGLTWSNTTKQLTVTAALDDVIGLGVQNTSAGTAAQCQVGFTANGGAISLLSLTGTNFSTSGIYHANQLYWRGTTGITDITFALDDASTNFRFAVNNVVAASINATSTEGLVLGIASSLTGRIKLFNSAGATYTQISAGNAAANLNYILPATSPTSGQVLSASAPSGSNVTLSWASATGTIGGTIADTQVAYGTGADTIGGNSAFTYISATNVLDVGFSTSGVVQSAQLKSPQITSGTASSITGTLEFYNSSNANLTRFTVGAAASALRYIWPTADPTAGQVLSASAPSGGDVTLSWAAAGSGLTVGSTTITSGTTGKALYDNAGVLGEANFFFSANTVDQRNSTNAQTMRIYRTYTDASNGSWIEINANANGNGYIGTNANGSGVGGALYFLQGGQGRWFIDGSGNFLSGSNNAFTLGSASNQVSSLYLGTNLFLGATSVGTSGVNVLAVKTGTAPTTSPAGMVQQYAAAAGTNDAQMYARNEAGEIARLTGTIAYLTSQFDVASNTTPQSITGLLRNVEASVRYKFEAVLFCTCGATGGVQIAMNGGTATATSVIFECQLYDDASTLTLISSSRHTALNTGSSAAASTGYFYRISGTILVNAAGTFGPAFAQNVSDGTNSSVLVNSSFQIWRS